MMRMKEGGSEKTMTKIVEISDAAYAVIIRHASSNGESTIWAVDELCSGANRVWVMEMPEMRKVWKAFQEYYATLPAFEGMMEK